MIFKDLFTDGEIMAYTAMINALGAIEDEETFDEFVAEIAGVMKDATPVVTARFVILGAVLGGFLVQRMDEDEQTAKSN